MRPIDADVLKQDLTRFYDNEVTAKQLIDEQPTVGGWVSVKDRLPENEKIVIGYTPCDGYMFIGFYRTNKFSTYEWSEWCIITSMRSTKKITKKVTHWMPLPPRPEVSE
jgi:hypothetical protein